MAQPTYSQEELEKALRCVVYDMLMLAVALRDMDRRHRGLKGLGLSKNQIAFEMAQIKFRSLHDFAISRETDKQFQNIKADQFNVKGEGKTFGTGVNEYRNSIGTFTAHLDWQRALRDEKKVRLPRPNHMVPYGMKVLERSDRLVQKALAKGLRLRKRAARYYRRYQDVLKQLKESAG